MSRSRWRILFGISVLGNVTGPDPASLRCAGQELANCIMIQSTKSAPSIAPEVALATQRRLPLCCRCTACFQLPKECRPNRPAVFKKKPELCLCQSQERLISSIFCSSAGGKSSAILVMAQWTGIASCACVIEIRCLELHNYFGHDLA